MLYITTRDNRDAFTTYKTLCENTAADGGQFVPFSAPVYSPEEISELKNKSFGQIVADLMNHFFSAKLSGWDVDFTIGRNAAKLAVMNHRIAVAELWHNPRGDFSYVVSSLYHKICNGNLPAPAPTKWFIIAVRIATIFGLYGELLRSKELSEGNSFDICVDGFDLSSFIAAWYARSYGLPIGKIVCAVTEDSCLWEFIHRGIFTARASEEASFGEVERLIQGTLGFEQVNRFVSMCNGKRTYSLDEDQLPKLNDGLFCCVTSKARVESTINSLYRSNGYISDSNTAFCYGGLQDYRAKTGESVVTLLFAEKTPLADAAAISSATGISKDRLTKHINFS